MTMPGTGLADAGVLAKRTMRPFDKMCLTPVQDMPPATIRALRLRESANQTVIARHLNVTTSPASQWEQHENRPRAAFLKLLTLVAKSGLGALPT